jgi:hypothetical protein
MQNDEVPAWANELRDFIEFRIGKFEEQTAVRFDGLESRMSSLEDRIIRMIDAMDARLGVGHSPT